MSGLEESHQLEESTHEEQHHEEDGQHQTDHQLDEDIGPMPIQRLEVRQAHIQAQCEDSSRPSRISLIPLLFRPLFVSSLAFPSLIRDQLFLQWIERSWWKLVIIQLKA